QGNLTLERAQFLKNQINYKEPTPLNQALGRTGTNLIKKAYTDAMTDAVRKHGTRQEFNQYMLGKNTYGKLARVLPSATKQSAREISNRAVSASDYGSSLGMGLGGAVIGAMSAPEDHRTSSALKSAVTGATLGLGHKFLRERGSSILSSAAQKLVAPMSSEPARRVIGTMQNLQYTPASNAAVQWLNRGDGTEE